MRASAPHDVVAGVRRRAPPRRSTSPGGTRGGSRRGGDRGGDRANAAATAAARRRGGVRAGDRAGRRCGDAGGLLYADARGEKPPMTTSEIRSTTAAASDAMGSTAAGGSGSGSGSGAGAAGGWVRASSESQRLSSSSARVERGDVGDGRRGGRRRLGVGRAPARRPQPRASRAAFSVCDCEGDASGSLMVPS